ncbi:ABC transporter permease [Vagococcus fessus]|uniref:ABC transporter permease n=1 Tax=Vagococcus fessus TaxID=120370 RepID=UPI000F89AF5B|nr:ABC transporter permease [Vagococcus fessus]
MTIKKRVRGLVVAVIILHIIWWGASLLLNKEILPGPLKVYETFPKLIENQLGWHILVSLRRMAIGMGSALMLGGIVGILMGRFSKVNHFLDPIIYLTYPIPKLALLPMIMLLFGLGELSKILLIILIVFPQVVLSVRDAILQIPKPLYDVYECMNASRWSIFKLVTFPASLGALLSTSRVSLGTAISVLFFTENYGTEYGMGHIIMDAWLRMDYPQMYGAILTLSLVGFLLFSLIDMMGRLLKKG